MNKETLIDELRLSLPDRRMFDVTNVCAVKIGNELIVMKNRFDFEVREEHLIKYDGDNYKDIEKKSVLFDQKVFSPRGQRAIMEYEIEEEFKYCQNSDCGKLLDRENNEYHRQYGTCNMYCYGAMVGVW